MNNGFDKLARPYRWMEYLSFGTALERCRFHFLPSLRHTQHALLLGDGDGRFTAALLQCAPAARALAMDASGIMLRTLRQRCERNGAATRITTVQADLRHGLPNSFLPSKDPVILSAAKDPSDLPSPLCSMPFRCTEPFDLIATHFFLDCLSPAEVEYLAADATAHAAQDATWVLSEFRIPRAGAMRLPSRLIVWALYLAFRVLTGLRASCLPDHASILRHHGWHLAEQRLRLGGLLTSERWQRDTAHGNG